MLQGHVGHVGQLPRFVMIGPDKTGTTGIFADLVTHRQIHDRVVCKETRFWSAPPVGSVTQRSCAADLMEKWSRRRLLSMYRRNFPPPCSGMIAGEASPQYFSSATAATLIARNMPNVLLLFFSRDPVQRFISRLVGNRYHQPGRLALPTSCAALIREGHKGIESCTVASRVASRSEAAGVSGPAAAGQCCIASTSVRSLWFDSNSAVGLGMYADTLQALWTPRFELGRRLLVMPSELFLPSNATLAALAYQRVISFLNLRPWAEAELVRRATAMQHVGSAHASTYARASLERSTEGWLCNQSHIKWLGDLYKPANMALAALFEKSEAALLQSNPKLPPIKWPLPAYLSLSSGTSSGSLRA